MRFKVDYYQDWVVVIDTFRNYKEYPIKLNGRNADQLAFECIKAIYEIDYGYEPTLMNELIEKVKKDLGL